LIFVRISCFFKILFSLCCLSLFISCENKKSDAFVIGFSDPVSTLNVFKMTGRAPWKATSFVYEPLFKKVGTEYLPVLGKNFKLSEKDKTLEITLRKGVNFTNGESLTSENIKFSHQTYINKAYGADLWRGMFDVVDKIELIDKFTAKIYFSKFSFNEVEHMLLQLKMFSKDFYSLKNQKNWSRKIVGTGPYKLVEFVESSKISLIKNTNWWAGSKNLKYDRIIIKKINDVNLAYQMIVKGKLHLYPLDSVNDYFNLSSKDGIKFSIDNKIHSYKLGFGFNLKNGLFSKNFRKAFSRLVNLNEINDKFFKSRLITNADSFHPDLKYYPKGKPLSYNPSEASKLLESEGWIDSNKDGVRDKLINGRLENLSFKMITTSPTQERVATYLKEEFKKQGVILIIEKSIDSTEYYTIRKEGRFESYVSEGVFADDHGASYLHSKAFYNMSGYNNPAVDEKVEALDQTFDLDTRLKVLSEIILMYRADRPESKSLGFKGKAYMIPEGLMINSDDTFNPSMWK